MATNKTRMKLHIKAGDTVMVQTGKDKGQTGKVIKVDRKTGKVLVEGVNMVQKHTKPNAQNQQGGIFEQESPLDYSNVLLYNPALKKGVRVRVDQSTPGVKKRLCAKTNNIL